ncbi:MAG TPA: hypothetical protein PKJ19_07305 [Flavobacteriales bacterium]|nr:hypothetical protein [Flavobacteriales bacterium]HNU57178.1 hypothetical protein [Flavobacteriales bacterium]
MTTALGSICATSSMTLFLLTSSADPHWTRKAVPDCALPSNEQTNKGMSTTDRSMSMTT